MLDSRQIGKSSLGYPLCRPPVVLLLGWKLASRSAFGPQAPGVAMRYLGLFVPQVW